MRFWIEISSATGTRTGRVDNALYWRHTARLDRAGAFEFAIPAADAKASLVVNLYRAFCYGVINGVVTALGAGIIDKIVTTQRGNDAPLIVVSGDDILRELAIHRVIAGGGAALEYNNSNAVPAGLIAMATAATTFPANWTLAGAATTGSTIYARFWNESILNGLTRVASTTGEHFRYTSSRTVTWLGLASSFVSSGVLATTNADPAQLDGVATTCLITSIEEVLESYDQVNRFYLYGSGDGEARLNLKAVETWPVGFVDFTTGTRVMTWTGDYAAADIGGDIWQCDRANSYLQNETKRLSHGYLMRLAQFKDIAPLFNTNADLADAADYLLQSGYNELRTRTSAQRSYKLSLAGLNTVLAVGTKLSVLARAVTTDDAGTRTFINIERSDLYILETQTQIDERGAQTVGVVVSTADRWPATNESAVIDGLNEAHTINVLPQMGVAVDTTRFRDPVDDYYSAQFDFFLSDYVTLVNQVVIRFRVDPLRSTVKSVTGGSGGSSAPTSSSESTHTHTTPSHYHTTVVVDGSAFTLVGNVNLYTSGGIYYIGHAAGGGVSRDVLTNLTGEGGTTSAAGAGHVHTVTIAAHTHTSTGVYGVYEESGANTYAYSDLEFSANGGAYASTVVSLGSGWYSIDLTSLLVDTKSRPLYAANYVTVRIKAASKVGKTVQVTAEIERRITIQSVQTA